MGNKACTLGIQTNSEIYTAGSKVTGQIYLSVTDPNGVKARSLNIRLNGREETKVHYTTKDDNKTHFHDDHRSATIFNSNVLIKTFQNGRIYSGQYEFPFELTLPSDLPSSMFYKCGRSCCLIVYEIKAYLSKEKGFVPMIGEWMNHSSSCQKIKLLGGGMPFKSSDPIVNPSDIQHVKHCCCINKGTMNISSEIESGWLCPGQRFSVSFLAENNSTTSPEGVQIVLKQTVSFKGHHRTDGREQNLIDSFVPKASIPHMMMQINDRMSDEKFLQNKSHTVNLVVPQYALSYHSGQLIQVRHNLLVKIKTPCCISSPETFNEITICHKNSLAEEIPPNNNMEYFEVTPSAPPLCASELNSEEASICPPEAVAVALPLDWNPEKADIVSVPLVHATIIDENSWNGTENSSSRSLLPLENEYSNASAPPL